LRIRGRNINNVWSTFFPQRIPFHFELLDLTRVFGLEFPVLPGIIEEQIMAVGDRVFWQAEPANKHTDTDRDHNRWYQVWA
jgi:hypothetical protein